MNSPAQDRTDDERTSLPPIAHAADGGEERSGVSRHAPQTARSAGDCEAAVGPCPGITGLQHSHTGGSTPLMESSRQSLRDTIINSSSPAALSPSPPDELPFVAAIDWFEIGAEVEWEDGGNQKLLARLEELRLLAKRTGNAEPYMLAGAEVMIQSWSMGKGRSPHLEFVLKMPDATLAFSERKATGRTNANFYLNVTGTACVVQGALAVRDLAYRMIEELGGRIVDDWFKRLDLCLDCPGIGLQDWMEEAVHAEQLKKRGDDLHVHYHRGKMTGFETGSRKLCHVVVYDKLEETFSRKTGHYQLAMIQNRWGGKRPEKAIRLEFQIAKEWLDQRAQLNGANVDEVLRRLPDIVQSLTSAEKNPFFCITDRPVDRKNDHQNRALPHPEWLRMTTAFQELAGTPYEPLRPVDRGSLECPRAISCAIGFLISAAVTMGARIASVADIVAFLHEQLIRLEFDDLMIFQRWDKKARAACLYHEPTQFRFGANAQPGQGLNAADLESDGGAF